MRSSQVIFSESLRESHPVSRASIAHRSAVYGAGVNDADYTTQPTMNGRRVTCSAYETWRGMLKRAYEPKFRSRFPTYVPASVCSEWHSFMEFRSWWIANHVGGWQIDKDLLVVGNKCYGPATCIYVPGWLNNFTIASGSARGNYPLGVCFDRSTGKLRSTCSNPLTGKQELVGHFTDPAEAHAAWRVRKLSIAEQLKPGMDEIDPRIYPNAVRIINQEAV